MVSLSMVPIKETTCQKARLTRCTIIDVMGRVLLDEIVDLDNGKCTNITILQYDCTGNVSDCNIYIFIYRNKRERICS